MSRIGLRGGSAGQPIRRRARPRRSRARSNTASSIGSVSCPVKVFCWLTWYEHSDRCAAGPARPATSTPWPNRGPGPHAEHAGQDLVAELARARRRRGARSSSASSRSRNGRHAVALVDGRLVGRRRAAHRRGDVGAGRASSPSSRPDALGPVGQPGAPQRPVEPLARAVAGEHPPGAVGAVRGRGQPDDHDAAPPDHRSRAPADPSSRRRGTRPASRAATCSRQATSRGQARHATTSAVEPGQRVHRRGHPTRRPWTGGRRLRARPTPVA